MSINQMMTNPDVDFKHEFPCDFMPLAADCGSNMFNVGDNRATFDWHLYICHLLYRAMKNAIEKSDVAMDLVPLRPLAMHIKKVAGCLSIVLPFQKES